EGARFSQIEHGTVVDVAHLGGVVGVDLDKSGTGPPLPIARPEIDPQDSVVDLVGDRNGRVVRHPLVLAGGGENPALLFPAPSHTASLQPRTRQLGTRLGSVAAAAYTSSGFVSFNTVTPAPIRQRSATRMPSRRVAFTPMKQ